MNWLPGSGRYPFRSESGLYLIERLASPESHWVAYFRPCLGTLTACGKARSSIEECQADAELHLEGLKEKAG